MTLRSVCAILALALASIACAGASTKPPVTPPDDTTTPPPVDTARPRWQRVADLTGQAIRGPAAFVIGGSAYVVSGNDGAAMVPSVWRYDTTTNAWTRLGDFPGTRRLDATSFAIGGKGYVALGTDNASGWLTDLWEYDPSGDQWTRRREFPASARILAPALVIGDKAYVVGGGTPEGAAGDVWEYDPPTDTWTRKADFPGPARSSAVAFTIGSRGYYGLGNASAGVPLTLIGDLWEYDPLTDTWTRKADLPGSPRAYALGFTMGTKGYVTQGMLDLGSAGTSLSLVRDLWEYDAQQNTWTRRSDFPGAARAMAVGFAIGSTGYIGLGNNSSIQNLRDLWALRP